MRIVKLGNLVTVMNEREDNPSQSKYDHFVGLEHYDSGSVSITRWGSTEMLVSAMKVFHRGDILVARRNVYLKRASTVDFDGITSGDSIILRVNDERYKAIVPFVLNTDSFWDYADQHSDGSMSKRLAPKTMLEYEFTLPDDEEVERLSTLLWAMERTKTAYTNLIAKTDELVKLQFIEMFDASSDTVSLEKCCTKIYGGGTPSMKHPEYYGGNIPFVKSGDVKADRISEGSLWLTKNAIEKANARLVPAGSVIVVVRSAALQHEFHAAIVEKPVVINQDIKSFIPKEDILPEYLLWAIKSREDFLLDSVLTMLTSHIETKILLDLPVKKASQQAQCQWKVFLEQSDKSKFAAQQALADLTATQKALMRQYLG